MGPLLATLLAALSGTDQRQVASETIRQVAEGHGAKLVVKENLSPQLRDPASVQKARLTLQLLKGMGAPRKFSELKSKNIEGEGVLYEQMVRFEHGDRQFSLGLEKGDGGFLIAGLWIQGGELAIADIDPGPNAPPHRVVVLAVESEKETESWILQAAKGEIPPAPQRVTARRQQAYIFPIIAYGYTPTRGAAEALEFSYEVRDPSGKQVPTGFEPRVVGVVDPEAHGVVTTNQHINFTLGKDDAAGDYTITGRVLDRVRNVSVEWTLTLVVP